MRDGQDLRRGPYTVTLALTLALVLASGAGAAQRPGDLPTSIFAAARAEAPPATDPTVPAHWTKWLPVVVFAVVSFPVLVLILAFVSRRRVAPVGPARKVALPEPRSAPPAETETAADLARPLADLELPPVVDPAAFCTRPDPAPLRQPHDPSEGAPEDGPPGSAASPAADPPLAAAPALPSDQASHVPEQRWCSTCAVAVGPGADDRLPPWCPRCGGSLGPIPEWARSRAAGEGRDPLGGPAPLPLPTVNGGEPLQAPPGKRIVFTATVKARCWKQHTCCACGCVYRYKFERAGVAQSGVRDFARSGAEKNLQSRLEREVDCYPCPTCGLVQPDMVAQTKLPWHAGVTVVLLVLLACAVIPAVYQGLTYHLAGLACAAVAGAGALLHLVVALYDPNRDREANRQKVKAQVERHRVEMVERGSMTDVEAPPRNLTWKHAAALLAAIVGAGFFLAPEIVRRNADLPVNPGLTPYVVAPGDEVKLGFPADHDIRSVGGRWRAVATAKVLNANEVGVPAELAAASSTDNWGTDFVIHEGSERVSPTLYARVQLPGDDAVAGKTLRLRISLDVTYPSASGHAGFDPTFKNQGTAVTRDFTVRVAGADDKQDYEDAWWTALAVGLPGSLGGGALLAWLALALRSRARPTELQAREV
jgi:hypothetical protein